MKTCTILKVTSLVVAAALAGCGHDDGGGLADGGAGGGVGGGAGAGGGAATISVAVMPPTVAVPAYASTRLVAMVSGTPVTGVIWSVEEPEGGTIVGDGAAGVYQAPATEGVYHVQALATADGSTAGRATIVVSNASKSSIQILPEPVSFDAIAIQPSASQTLTAVYFMSAVTWEALVPVPVPEVQWSIIQGATGGSITADGTYAAPPTPGIFHVLASVPGAPAASAVAEVQVSSSGDGALAVAPAVARIAPGATVQFSGHVSGGAGDITWSVLGNDSGTISSTGLYTAPSAPGVYVVQARGSGRVLDALGTVVVQ